MYIAKTYASSITIPTKISPSQYCCDSPQPYQTESDLVCLNCGTIINSGHLVNIPESIYEKTGKRTHEIFSYTLFKNHTMFQAKTDYKKTILPAQIQHLFTRLARLQTQCVKHSERSLTSIESRLLNIRSHFAFSDEILKNSLNTIIKIIRGKYHGGYSINEICIVTVYYFLKRNRIPHTLLSLSKFFSINLTRFRSFLIRLTTVIIPKINPQINQNIGLKISPIETYCEKLCDELNIPYTIRQQILINAKRISHHPITFGKLPQGIASAIVYYIANTLQYRIVQTNITKKVNITEVTLRVMLPKIKKYIKIFNKI